ncbi:MAG: amidohydrolase [Myxococcota bacterium]|nr:amidohydrolase [Myxococcota bacterium]
MIAKKYTMLCAVIVGISGVLCCPAAKPPLHSDPSGTQVVEATVTPSDTQPADLVLTNGKIVTVEADVPEVAAIAIKGDSILAMGSAAEIERYIHKETRVIDLVGKLAMPGFIESHAHFLSLGHAKMRLDLTDTTTWQEVLDRVARAVKQATPGERIYGRGWHQEKWTAPPEPNVDGLPVHGPLSAISPRNPVILTHASGHSCIANAKAMAVAGITAKTRDPKGGEIVKDTAGEPIGVFRETATDLLERGEHQNEEAQVGDQDQAAAIKAMTLAEKECLAKGITTFHDAGTDFATIDLMRHLLKEGTLKLRFNVMVSEDNKTLKEHLRDYKIIGGQDHHLTVRTIKRLIDGALGAHGAWLLAPYNSLPTSTGLNTEAIDSMKEVAEIAIENGFQLATHAIGDRANQETLDIYEAAFKRHPDKKDLRWRIEHAQHLSERDIPRFGDLGVTASMQAIHCTSDGPWVFKRLGKKRAEEGAYVWQKLMETGAMVCNGTDAPVEDVDPIANFHAAVTRQLKDGTVFFPDQRMTREQALRSYTINGAYAAFEESLKGSLKPGKLADIVVLSKDIMTVPNDEILKTEVLFTIIGGEVVYQK